MLPTAEPAPIQKPYSRLRIPKSRNMELDENVAYMTMYIEVAEVTLGGRPRLSKIGEKTTPPPKPRPPLSNPPDIPNVSSKDIDLLL